MKNRFEDFARKLAEDALKRFGELIIDIGDDQVPLLKPSIEALQNGTRRYSKSKKPQKEKDVRDKLAARFPGSRVEVRIEGGKRIDILTPSKVIEVKNVKGYLEAIGQVQAYGLYYPKHEQCIYLFGEVFAEQRRLIQKECSALNITVEFV